MKFKYKKLAPNFFRPIIPVTLKFNNKSIQYEALVDSGADMCAFPAEIGELLGIDILRGKIADLTGVTGKSEKMYYHPITIEIGGNETRIEAGFTYSQNFSHGFLGQRGIFNIYSVHFFYRKGIVELRPDIHIN
jgi:hypothetical protein